MGRNAAIANAAAAAGFDVTDTTKLINLIHAIRDADQAMYPDHYEGTGRYKSDLYPDHWVAAEMHQQRARREYQDLEKSPSVPAFIFSAQPTAREQLNENTNFPSARGIVSGANAEPLGIKTSKRTAVKLTSPPQRTSLDFTQDKYAVHPSARLYSSPSPLRNHTNYHHTASGKADKKKPNAGHVHRQLIRTSTTVLLCNVRHKLKLSEGNLQMDRESLRKRWEIDFDLQLQNVTDDLQEINECFSRAEKAIGEAITVFEERLI